jgi:hypothetical protein
VRFLKPEWLQITSPVTPEVTPKVSRLLTTLQGEMSWIELMAALGLKDEKHFREYYQQAATALGLIEMTLPDNPAAACINTASLRQDVCACARLRRQGDDFRQRLSKSTLTHID